MPVTLLLLMQLLADPSKLPPVARHAVDVLIGLSVLIYLILLIDLYRKGPDVFEATGFESIGDIRRWLLGAILLLAFMLVLDSAIALDFALFSGRRAAGLIAIGSAVIIPVLLAAALLYPTGDRTGHSVGDRSAERSGSSSSAEDIEADRAVIDALDELLGGRGLHRDPDLTLSRLARRLGLPAKRVSVAVNRVRGMNVRSS